MTKNLRQTENQPLSLSIIIPAYNEEATILLILNKIKQLSLQRPFEVVVVDDGSTDQTGQLVEQFSRRNPQMQISCYQQENQGKGGAVKKGIQNSTGDILLVQDADLEYDPKDYQKILPLIDNGALVVYGSRNLKQGPRSHSTLLFYWGGRLVTTLTNWLYGSQLTDEATCYKVFHRSLFVEVDFQRKDFSWEPEITAKILKRGIPIPEVPISYFPRSKSEGKKISWKDGVIAIWVLVYERFKKT